MIVWELDVETRRFTHVSGRVASALGYPVESWRDRPGFWIGIVHPDDRHQVATAVWRVITRAGSCEIDYRAVAVDGRVLRLRDRVRAVTDEQGRTRLLRGASLEVNDVGAGRVAFATPEPVRVRRRTDITPPELAAPGVPPPEELVLRAHILDALGEAVVASDIDHRVVYWNHAAEALLGWTADEALGRSDSELVPARPGREETAAILAGVVHGRPWSAQVDVRSRHGISIPVLLTAGPVRREDGSPAGVVAVLADLRRIRSFELRQRRARVMDAVARTASGIATELEHSRTRIERAARQLLDQIPQHDPARAHAEEVHRSADAFASLANELATAGREQTHEPQRMDLNEAVTRAIPLVRVLCGERIELLTDLNPSCGHVRADPRHINQIILNIAADACHAMSGRGRLTVRTMNADLVWPATGGTTPPAGRYVLLEIRDMREPPPTELLDAIFEPYMRAAGQVGLRLSVAHALVTQNEGWISAEPAAGGGLAFRIHFPRLDEEAPTAQ